MCYHVRGTLCQVHHKSGLSRPTGGRRQAVASTRYEFDPKFRMDLFVVNDVRPWIHLP